MIVHFLRYFLGSFQQALDTCIKPALPAFESCADGVSRSDIETSFVVINSGWSEVCRNGAERLAGKPRFIKHCEIK